MKSASRPSGHGADAFFYLAEMSIFSGQLEAQHLLEDLREVECAFKQVHPERDMSQHYAHWAKYKRDRGF
jgi:hypothetical protein